jgi:hypothetical protein
MVDINGDGHNGVVTCVIVPVDKKSDGTAPLRAVGSGKRPIRRDETRAAEWAWGRRPVALHRDEERVLVRRGDDLAPDDITCTCIGTCKQMAYIVKSFPCQVLPWTIRGLAITPLMPIHTSMGG